MVLYEKSLHWFRRDLRISDNKALSYATQQSRLVLLCFIFDTSILNSLKNKKDARVEFILNSLKEIQKENLNILILKGKPEILIPKVCKEFKISAVFTNEDYELYAKKRDKKVQKV